LKTLIEKIENIKKHEQTIFIELLLNLWNDNKYAYLIYIINQFDERISSEQRTLKFNGRISDVATEIIKIYKTTPSDFSDLIDMIKSRFLTRICAQIKNQLLDFLAGLNESELKQKYKLTLQIMKISILNIKELLKILLV
jgi:hypothetical protein